jgi:hypothetical protein
MNETLKPSKKTQAAAKPETCAPGTVFCRRVKVALPITDHQGCPYCFGKDSDIKTGDHEKFCDFQEGKDPICFGFPET